MFQLKRDQQFDEQYYLAEYPDVAKAVESGAIASAEMHYRKHGRREGRRPCAPPPLPPEKSPELPVTTSPVAFFIFNRPDLTRLSFERIASYQPHRLYLIADAARSDAERERVEATRAVVEQIDWPCEVARVYAEKNMGCKQRLVSGLQYVFERETQAIIVEDDVLAHPDFFEFCHTMLEAYRDDERVMHVSGSNFLAPGTASPPCWFSRHSDIWGWATWRRAFQRYDPDLASWRRPRWLGLHQWLGDTPFEKRYWAEHFDRIQSGEIDTWDYQWHYTIYKAGGLAVVPYANLITNLGHGALATHTRDEGSGIARLKAFQIGPLRPRTSAARNRNFDEETFLRRYAVDSQPRLPVVDPKIFSCERGPETLVICHNEISDRHGVGALLGKLLRSRQRWFYIRTTTHFENLGSNDREIEMPADEKGDSWFKTYSGVSNHLEGRRLEVILCVPYATEEAMRAIAAARMTQAPLVVYLMDDQNVHVEGIPDGVMRELLEVASRRFAICEEMKIAYEKKYGKPIETLYPAVDKAEMVDVTQQRQGCLKSERAVLIGNIWTSAWIRRFAHLLRKSGLQADWYGNAAGRFREVPDDELARSGLFLKGFLPQEKMSQAIRNYGYAVVPTASADDDASHRWMAKLSFPSKIMTLLFSGGLPVMVLADETNPAATFIQASGLGVVVPYDSVAVAEGFAQLQNQAWLQDFRKRLEFHAEQHSLVQTDKAIWSIAVNQEAGGA